MGLFDFVSDIFGGSSSGGSSAGNASADEMARIARELWNQSKGVRDPLISQMANFMTNGWDPTQSSMWDPLKAGVEQQYSTARNNILSNVPAGGPLLENLADMETSKANTLSGLAGNMIQDMYNKAYGISTNSPQQSISGMLGAGQLYNQAYMGNASNQIANQGGLSSLLNLGQGLGNSINWIKNLF